MWRRVPFEVLRLKVMRALISVPADAAAAAVIIAKNADIQALNDAMSAEYEAKLVELHRTHRTQSSTPRYKRTTDTSTRTVHPGSHTSQSSAPRRPSRDSSASRHQAHPRRGGPAGLDGRQKRSRLTELQRRHTRGICLQTVRHVPSHHARAQQVQLIGLDQSPDLSTCV